jgi:NADPH:quinone reductase
VTSVRALRSVGEVKAGDHVLIHGGASGTGSMAIQVAHALGAKVAATVRSSRKAKFVESLGPERVIDLSKQDFVAQTLDWTAGRGADVVIDNLGGDFTGRSLAAVRRQGVVVSIGFVTGVDVSFNIVDFFFAQKQLRGSLMGNKEDLEWGLAKVRAGAIRPLMDKVMPLGEISAAHRLLSGSEILGNLALDPWS